MLIESTDLHNRLKHLMIDARDSSMLFSHYKVAVDVIQKIIDIVEDIETTTAGLNAQHKYAAALEGLKDK